MNYELIFKALSNPLRLQIFGWLKNADENFGQMCHLPEEERGKGYVCVGLIQEKAGATQSTISSYLSQMKQAGLLECKRIGQWTYYRRNEEAIQKLARHIETEL